MKIVRDGVEYELTSKEIRDTVREWKHKCAIETVDSYITCWCEDYGIAKERISDDTFQCILDEYEDQIEMHEEMDDGFYLDLCLQDAAQMYLDPEDYEEET